MILALKKSWTFKLSGTFCSSIFTDLIGALSLPFPFSRSELHIFLTTIPIASWQFNNIPVALIGVCLVHAGLIGPDTRVMIGRGWPIQERGRPAIQWEGAGQGQGPSKPSNYRGIFHGTGEQARSPFKPPQQGGRGGPTVANTARFLYLSSKYSHAI